MEHPAISTPAGSRVPRLSPPAPATFRDPARSAPFRSIPMAVSTSGPRPRLVPDAPAGEQATLVAPDSSNASPGTMKPRPVPPREWRELRQRGTRLGCWFTRVGAQAQAPCRSAGGSGAPSGRFLCTTKTIGALGGTPTYRREFRCLQSGQRATRKPGQ